jgi:nitrous oxide reductase accessory protein NosL
MAQRSEIISGTIMRAIVLIFCVAFAAKAQAAAFPKSHGGRIVGFPTVSAK